MNHAYPVPTQDPNPLGSAGLADPGGVQSGWKTVVSGRPDWLKVKSAGMKKIVSAGCRARLDWAGLLTIYMSVRVEADSYTKTQKIACERSSCRDPSVLLCKITTVDDGTTSTVGCYDIVGIDTLERSPGYRHVVLLDGDEILSVAAVAAPREWNAATAMSPP